MFLAYLREIFWMVISGLLWPLGLLRWRPKTGRKPIILLHGQGHNRSGWLLLHWRLRRAGFGPIHALNFRGLRQGRYRLLSLLRHLREQEIREVDLVGHSQGAILAAQYLRAQQMKGIAVGRLISIAGRLHHPVPQLHAIAASHDWLVPRHSVLVSDRQAVIPRRSHLSVLYSGRTHRQVLRWLSP